MPRQSGRRPAVSRPAARPSAPQSRQAHTAAAPQTHAAPPPAASQVQSQPQQPGMFAQMASTAAGVAVGSTIGHTLGAGITSMFGGSSAPAEQPQQQAASFQQERTTNACDMDARAFTKCLDENNGNMQICDWYLQQLKSCQAAASQY